MPCPGRQANRPMCWASKSAVRWRSRMLTVSQLSRQAKENPVRGADFERGKFAGGRGPSTHRAHAQRRAEGYYHRLPLIICPEPDSEWMMNLGIFCLWNSRVVSPVRTSAFQSLCGEISRVFFDNFPIGTTGALGREGYNLVNHDGIERFVNHQGARWPAPHRGVE
jgi:hypothetical protein